MRFVFTLLHSQLKLPLSVFNKVFAFPINSGIVVVLMRSGACSLKTWDIGKRQPNG
jgi:hypothetical protein